MNRCQSKTKTHESILPLSEPFSLGFALAYADGFGFVVARFGIFLREIESTTAAIPVKSSATLLSFWRA
jgi:hypothetical protein